jgi:TPR repeat protein
MAISLENPYAKYNLGNYYENIEKNYDLMKKYFLMAIEKGNAHAMNNLGYHYRNIEKNYDLAKKYYLMAISLGDSDAMYNLGHYYEHIEINYDLSKKYYLMAISLGNTDAMCNLGNYYENIEKNYDLMKKYFLMAIEKGNTHAMNNLGYYYEHIEKNYDLSKKYYLLIIDIDINKFREFFVNYIQKTIELERLIINDICNLFDYDSLKFKKIKILMICIFDYLKSEQNYDKLPENIDMFILYTAKIMFKKSKKEDSKEIVNVKLIDKNEKHKKIIEKLINDSVDSSINFSRLFINKYLKAMYEGYKEQKYIPGNKGYLKAKKDFEMRSGSESGGKSEGIVNKEKIN